MMTQTYNITVYIYYLDHYREDVDHVYKTVVDVRNFAAITGGVYVLSIARDVLHFSTIQGYNDITEEDFATIPGDNDAVFAMGGG